MTEGTILVAIEDALLLRTVSWFLREHGYEVLEAPSADRIFELFAAAVPDLFMLDVTAPALPGPRLLEWLKAEEPWREMPVLILTGMPPDDETVRMLGLGAADFIGKPFRVRELLARVQVQLRIRQMLREAREALLSAHAELGRARTEADNQRELVGILHEVAGDLSPDEIYHLLVRRVARALDISHCSLILACPGDERGSVATSYEDPALRDLQVELARYPEVMLALERGEPVLIEDVATDPLYDQIREAWQKEGRAIPARSAIAMRFDLNDKPAGVFFLRTTDEDVPLNQQDVQFANQIITAAVSSLERAYDLQKAVTGQ
ncbi:MAG TPA: response regulator, partial [Gemmatimonadaceae bacterium]|nr:response regulator [Gemmatimonadaceae bacterium]